MNEKIMFKQRIYNLTMIFTSKNINVVGQIASLNNVSVLFFERTITNHIYLKPG